MRWTLTQGDILQQPADVLVCSANVFLNLSGGVGGAILLRCGDAIQNELHDLLSHRGKHYAERGEVFHTAPHGLPFTAILHAVAVDAFYQSSPEIISNIVANALNTAATLNARRVALTALATGYGRLRMEDFAAAIRPLLHQEFGAISEVVICVKNAFDLEELSDSLPELA